MADNTSVEFSHGCDIVTASSRKIGKTRQQFLSTLFSFSSGRKQGRKNVVSTLGCVIGVAMTRRQQQHQFANQCDETLDKRRLDTGHHINLPKIHELVLACIESSRRSLCVWMNNKKRTKKGRLSFICLFLSPRRLGQQHPWLIFSAGRPFHIQFGSE